MRICFIILLAGILRAADGQPEGKRVVSTVHADPQTGKLVRSVIVTPKTGAAKPATPTVAASQVVPTASIPAPITPRDPAPATANAPNSATAPGPSAPGATPTPDELNQEVAQVAARHALPAELLDSVIRVESNYNPNAVSPKGALGLMQLIPDTARRFGVGDVFNPLENLEGGACYLRYLLDLYGGNYPLALAAYNAGEGAVAKYAGVPPYRETRNYVLLVKKELDKAAGVKHVTLPPPPAILPTPDGAAHIEEVVETDGSVRYVSRK